MQKPVRTAAARKARAPLRTTSLLLRALGHLAQRGAAAAAAWAALAAEKRKLPRLRFASVSPSVRPSVSHRVSSAAAAAAGTRTGSSPLQSARALNPLSGIHQILSGEIFADFRRFDPIIDSFLLQERLY